MANDYQAINLAQGFPNFPVDERLIQLLQETSTENAHQYAPMAGHPSLLEEIALLTEKSYGRTVNPNTEILKGCVKPEREGFEKYCQQWKRVGHCN